MEEMLENSTPGFSDVLEKVCPPAALSTTYMFSVMSRQYLIDMRGVTAVVALFTRVIAIL